MNKILSQALKKAVSEYSPNNSELSKSKGPDLFSLSNDTELFQNEKGIIIKIGFLAFLRILNWLDILPYFKSRNIFSSECFSFIN